jgi:hypothetical protein
MTRSRLPWVALCTLAIASCKKPHSSASNDAGGSIAAASASSGRLELELPPPVAPAPTIATPGTPQNLAAKTPGVGDTASLTDYKLTLLAVKECKVETYFRPKAGSIKLGVQLALEGTRDLDVPVSPFHARLSDTDGTDYSATLAGCTPILPSVRVARGERAEGWITFEVPEKATGLVLLYDPVIIGGSEERARFSLGR